jgi:putative ATP-dependent endonuclease of OLD family
MWERSAPLAKCAAHGGRRNAPFPRRPARGRSEYHVRRPLVQVRHLKVNNFRGIESLDWALDARFVVLIGPGDVGKSTLLDALALVLSASWRPTITDADFCDCDFGKTIVIEATVTGVPAALLREDRFGHYLCGVAPDGSLHAEPEANDVAGLTIRLTVASTLEPEWDVIRESGGEGVRISAGDRARLGMFRLGDSASAQLRWSRDSALSRLGEFGDVGAMLLGAHRTARETVFDNPSPSLAAGAHTAAEAVRKLGGADLEFPRPGLEPAGSGRASNLVLHDGEIPVTSLGSGSQRIAGVAFQLEAVESQSIVLIDEVELGLEPHRLLHLVAQLKERARRSEGQVVLTTHSPVVVSGVDATDLHIVRRSDAKRNVAVRPVPAALGGLGDGASQAAARSGPAAMLAQRIVVCEGATEVGVCRALFRHWDRSASIPAALMGAVACDGGGNSAPSRAECLVRLGYAAALFIDSDLGRKDAAIHAAAVTQAAGHGAEVFRWPVGRALEHQVALSMPKEQMRQLVAVAAEFQGSEESVRDAVAAQLEVKANVLMGLDPVEWMKQANVDRTVVREAIGRAAVSRKWFKMDAKGERLGELIVAALPQLTPENPLTRTLDGLRNFVYAASMGCGDGYQVGSCFPPAAERRT